VTSPLTGLQHWWARLRTRYPHPVPARGPDPIRTKDLAQQLRGQWIAMQDGEVIDAGPTFDQLVMRLHERGIKISSVTVMRLPAEDEAELVGLG
jgi:hypothetical protein